MKSAFALMTAMVLLLSTACTPPVHPGEINAFDGSTYDALLASHGALTQLRAEISTTYPQFKADFDLAAHSYATVYYSYSIYRTSATPSTQAQVAAEIATLTTAVMSLEQALQAPMKVTPADVKAAQHSINTRAKKAQINLSSILNILEVAAAIAEAVPQAAPYAALAQAIIAATNQAVASVQAGSGQPIDMTQIAPVAVIQ